MNYIIKISALSALFFACGTSEKTTHVAPAEAEPQHIELTAEQIKTAGIEVGKLSRQTIDALVHVVGKIALSPMQRASVHATAVGYIRKINLQMGDRVQKGQVLAVLEHPSYIEKQRELLETKSRLPFLEAEVQRKKELQTNDAGPMKNYQSAQADYDWAKSHFEGLKTELALLGFNVDKIIADGQYQSQLSLEAPASGIITELFVNPGKLVQPETMICEISDISQPYTELQVFAPQLGQIREGQSVDIRLSGSTQVYPAVISKIVQQVDEVSKTAVVRAMFKSGSEKLMAGMVVQGDVHIPAQNEWVLPKESVLQTDDKTFAFGISGNTVRLVPVQVKSETDDYLAVEADTAQTFVLKGGYYLRDRF